MQKLINVMALASFAVSGVVVAGGVYVYVNKDSIVDNVKSQVIKAATEGIGNAMGAGLAGQLPSAVEVPTTEVPSDLPVPIPTLPF